MVNQRKKVNENPMPVMDEGWWESVLAEEGSPSAMLRQPAPRACRSHAPKRGGSPKISRIGCR